MGGIATSFFFREEVTLLGGQQAAQTTLHAVSPQFVRCLRFLKLPSGQLIISKELDPSLSHELTIDLYENLVFNSLVISL